MNTAQKLASATVLATFASAAATAVLAATVTPVTQSSIEKHALALHPGKISMSKQEQRNGKNVWHITVKGQDNKEYTMYFDAKTGLSVN
jgi:uncharacterized membrane protein YkoI